jgi:hypothetical protein
MGPSTRETFEWVYNRANIDNAEIVWARELAPQQNRKLLDYFTGRHVWLLKVNNGLKLIPYPATQT